MPAQDFVLDFKFGGNAEFLTRLESLMQRVDKMFDATATDIKETTDATNELNKAAGNSVSGINRMSSGLANLAGSLKSVIAGYVGLNGIRKVMEFGNGSIDLFNQQNRQERLLQTVLNNKGLGGEFEGIKQYASDIQGRTIYGDEAMIAGAGELATYVKSGKSMKRMMDLLANYAAGMTGGGEVTPQQMVDLATGLGKAFDGTYDAMRKKGFDVEGLKKLKELEDAGIAVSDEQKIAALEKSLADWNGLAESFANTDEGRIISIKNTIGDMREDIGKRLLPVVARLMDKVRENLPKIQKMMDGLATIFEKVGNIILDNMDNIMKVGEMLSSVLSFLAEYPSASAIVVMSLMALRNGFLSAGEGASKMSAEIEKSAVSMMKANKQASMLVGGAGFAAGFSAVGEDKGEAENAVGGLKAMGMAAAFGASQFGLLGAAIGAVSSTLGSLVSGLIGYIKASGQADETIAEIEERGKAMDNLIRLRKEWKEGTGGAGAAVNYQSALSEFESKYGRLEGSYLVDGFSGRSVYGKALDEALKTKVDVKVNSDNTITQNVSMETSLAEASVIMRANLREFIQEQLNIDASTIGAQFAQ